MDASLREQLSEYLRYMDRLGFQGLALARSPFAREQRTARQSSGPRPPRQQSSPPAQAAPTNAPSRKAVASHKPARPPNPAPSADLGNLFSLMEAVDTGAAEKENRGKAEAVTGADRVALLRNLYGAFQHCQACALGTTRHRFVFGEGPPDAELMFVGDGPGAEEDKSGRPFMGEVGDLLNRIVEAMGLQRSQVFITDAVKCRPPDDRAPLSDETATCSPILARQIDIVRPRAIIALGPIALRFFVEDATQLARMRGRFIQWHEIPVMPTHHPAYVLRHPRAKREVWEDMKQVMALLNAKGSSN